jgi:hypothetical protein
MASFAAAGNVAVGQLTRLPFRNIIGGPLTSAIEAQAKAAQTTVEFIKAVGFNEVNGQLEAVNLTFSYEDATGMYRRVIVPLLSVIPIPFIVIDTVNIQFKAQIQASASESSETTESTSAAVSGTAKFRFWGQSLDITGSYSSKKDSKATQDSKYSVEYTMDVQVTASQGGIPTGMAQILNILQEGISNRPSTTQVTLYSVDQLLKKTDTGKSFNVLVLDSGGEPVSGATVAMTSAGGLITAASGTEAPSGLYSVPLAPNTTAVGALTADANETIQVTVTVGSETMAQSRLITVRNA